MALEHALLVSLSEQAGSGIELSRRFDRSIGFFWRATHQQIYRTLARMERDGWVAVETVEQSDRPHRKVYGVTSLGAQVLADWLVADGEDGHIRSDLSVRLRGASFGDRTKLLEIVRQRIAEHRTRLAAYEQMCTRDYPNPRGLEGGDLDRYLVLRGGIRFEQFWIEWLTEYLDAH